MAEGRPATAAWRRSMRDLAGRVRSTVSQPVQPPKLEPGAGRRGERHGRAERARRSVHVLAAVDAGRVRDHRTAPVAE